MRFWVAVAVVFAAPTAVFAESVEGVASETPAAPADPASASATAAATPGQATAPSSPPATAPAAAPKKRPKGYREQKENEGTEAPGRFEADTILKSQYQLNGQSLEVDPD